MKNVLALALLIILISFYALSQSSTDATLRNVMEKDRTNRDSAGGLQTLSAAEHLSRGQTYYDNRQFAQAREHFQKIFDNYPTDSAMSSGWFSALSALLLANSS